jgi:cardiolipin synthase
VIDGDPLDVGEADNIFRADWDRIAPVLNDSDLLVSPVNARSMFGQLIGRARHSIDVYSEEMLDQGVVRQLARAARRGVRVRVLAATVATWARARLISAGALVGKGSTVAGGIYIHAKALIIDDRLGFVGSENFSSTSLDQNRELGVILTGTALVARLEATFRRDWSR